MPKTLAEILTARELEFAHLISEGLSNRDIARETGCAHTYINYRLSILYAKLGYSRGASSLEPRVLLAVRYDREFGRESGE